MQATGIIIGRIVDKEIFSFKENESTVIEFTLGVKRNTKDADGKYRTDFLKIKAANEVAKKYYKIFGRGNMIATSIRIQTKKIHIDDISYYYQNELIAEDVTLMAESFNNWRYTDEESKN